MDFCVNDIPKYVSLKEIAQKFPISKFPYSISGNDYRLIPYFVGRIKNKKYFSLERMFDSPDLTFHEKISILDLYKPLTDFPEIYSSGVSLFMKELKENVRAIKSIFTTILITGQNHTNLDYDYADSYVALHTAMGLAKLIGTPITRDITMKAMVDLNKYGSHIKTILENTKKSMELKERGVGSYRYQTYRPQRTFTTNFTNSTYYWGDRYGQNEISPFDLISCVLQKFGYYEHTVDVVWQEEPKQPVTKKFKETLWMDVPS